MNFKAGWATLKDPVSKEEEKKDKVKSLDQCSLEGKYEVVTSKVPWNPWAVTEN